MTKSRSDAGPAGQSDRKAEPQRPAAARREQERAQARQRADDITARYRNSNSDGDAVTTNAQAGTVGGQLDKGKPAERKR